MVILLTFLLDFDLTLKCEIECIRGYRIDAVRCMQIAFTKQKLGRTFNFYSHFYVHVGCIWKTSLILQNFQIRPCAGPQKAEKLTLSKIKHKKFRPTCLEIKSSVLRKINDVLHIEIESFTKFLLCKCNPRRRNRIYSTASDTLNLHFGTQYYIIIRAVS